MLEDQSKNATPTEWASEAVALYKARKADLIVGEINQGGEMVENTLRVVDRNVPFKAVHASRGKAIRAEPVQSLYEQGRVFHCREFPELEAEMTTWVPRMRMKSYGVQDGKLPPFIIS